MKRPLALLLACILLLTTFAGCGKKKPGAKADDTAEYEALYAPVLKKYKQAFEEEWPREKFLETGLAPNLAGLEKTAEPSFAFLDLNNDKTPELFIGRADEAATVYDLYTADGENIKHLIDAAGETTLTLTDDARLAEKSDAYESLEVTTFYKMDDDSLTPTDSYIHDPDKIIDGMDEWYHKTGELPKSESEFYAEDMEVISKDDYDRGATGYTEAKLAMKEFAELDAKQLPDSDAEIDETEVFLAPTAEDFAVLGSDHFDLNLSSFVNQMSRFFLKEAENDYNHKIADFDCTSMDTKALKENFFYYSSSMLYDYCFDTPKTVHLHTADISLSPDQADVQQAYQSAIANYPATHHDYTIYDIDKDGTPELLIDSGLPEATRKYTVYTYDNGLKQVGEFNGFHTSLYEAPGENGVYAYLTHMGTENFRKITMEHNGLKEETLFERYVDVNEDYTNIDEMAGEGIFEVEATDLSLLSLSGVPYMQYPEKNILWITKNVLNMTQPFVREDFLTQFKDQFTCIYIDGFYHFREWVYYDQYSTNGIYTKIQSIEPIDDHRYQVNVNYIYYVAGSKDSFNKVYGNGTMIVALKKIGNQRVWSIYSYSADIMIDENWTENMQEAMPDETTDPVPEKTADDIYSEVLQTYMDKWDASEDFIYREYAFHDIDEDGTDELIVHDGAGEMDRTYYFYTAKNGAAIHLGDCEGWHAALSDGDRCVTLRAGMNGEGVATRISIADDALLMDEGEAYTFPPTPDFGPDIEFTTY